MYQYDEFDLAFLKARNEQFRQQVARRLSGALTEEEFRPLRLMNGIYLQLHAYMLRVAIPYGSLNSRQMLALADIADRWDKGYGHFTTRQNIQFNWPKLVDLPDILDALAEVQMHAIQTSGNVIRNVVDDKIAERDGKVDLNNSSVRRFQQFPGMYPTMAGKIVLGGPYDSVDDVLSLDLTERQKELFSKIGRAHV